MVKISVISTSVFPCPPPGYSGLEMIAWLCAKGLAELGHQVSLIAPWGSSCPNVEIVPTGPPGTWDEKKAFDAVWQRLIGQDVIIDHSWGKRSYLLKQEGVLKAPCLGVLHAPVNTMYQQLPPVEKPCMVCISKDQASHFEALHGREARVCYNGVDPEVYKPLDIPRTDRFLFCGRFSSIKGPDIAIRACKEAGVGLDLIGDLSITQEPELYERCRKMADGEQIRILGPQTRGACVWWMSQAHAFIHPAFPFREPFGLAPVEAMLCGLPVIASDNGALRETVRHGLGFLVKNEKELVHKINLIKGSEISEERRNNCREWAKRFSPEAMCKRYEELCKEAVETGGW